MEFRKRKRSRIDFEIEEKLKQVINKILPNTNNYEDVSFIFEFEDKQEKLDSGIDEMLNFWYLPNIYGRILKYYDVLEILNGRNKFPLWIKVSLRFEKQVILQISKRFRGEKLIKDFHNNNELRPFVIVNSSKDILEQTLERFFSKRELFDYEIDFLKQQRLNIEKIIDVLTNNFEKSRFYPNKFLIFSPIQASYKGVIIERMYDNSYQIHEQIENDSKELMMQPDRVFMTKENAITEYIKYFPEMKALEILEN